MSDSSPKVRDFTDKERSLDIFIETDPIYEVLLAMFVFQGEIEHDQYEHVADMLEAVDSSGDTTLADDVRSLGGCGDVALTLLGVAHELDGARTTEALISRLRQLGSAELRTLLMRSSGIKASKGHDQAMIDRAAKGDIEAVRELFTGLKHHEALQNLLERDPETMLDEVISVLERFTSAVEPLIERCQPVIQRDAANTRAMAKTMRPERLVEKATNGITFEMQPQVGGVLLLPSVIVRPWVVIAEHGMLRIFAYGVSDEVLAADDDAPPAFLVDTFKALADENRLRMLGVLAEGDMGLKELAQRVDVAKSTAHHHLRALRSAGLVRVIVSEDDKRYSLRRDSIHESGLLLESFLTSRSNRKEDTQ